MYLTIGTLIGGLGLFLLAVSMITDGLKLAAGDNLKLILQHWTNTRLRGVASGLLVTGIVQSSSAVTLATIGFVNAGLLTLGQALGVIYGANVGTTMTGWIVAAVGFDIRIEVLALPLIGVGMFARILKPRSRIGSVGLALAGFGLFFIGIDAMKGAFETVAADFDLAGRDSGGWLDLPLFVLLGILMTVLTQSSSAAIAITLTAATGGVLTLDAAAATVIGANVGTTSTAALAVIGATANARRVAAAHVVFNLVTGLAALALLPLMLWLVRVTGGLLGLQDVPAVSLALFHTVFNILGVVLMWPFTSRLTHFLLRRFTTQAERVSRLQYLDANVLETPSLALEALDLELKRAVALTLDLVQQRLAAERNTYSDQALRAGIMALGGAIADFVTRIGGEQLPRELQGRSAEALRILAYLEEVVGLLDDYDAAEPDIDAISLPAVRPAFDEFIRQVRTQLHALAPDSPDIIAASSEDRYRQLRVDWRELKAGLLEAASRREIPVQRLSLALEGLRGILRVAEQLMKAVRRLQTIAERRDTAPADDT